MNLTKEYVTLKATSGIRPSMEVTIARCFGLLIPSQIGRSTDSSLGMYFGGPLHPEFGQVIGPGMSPRMFSRENIRGEVEGCEGGGNSDTLECGHRNRNTHGSGDEGSNMDEKSEQWDGRENTEASE